MVQELLVISGKGGTGKTSVVGSLAALAKNKVLVDCDVDAADLHLLLAPRARKTYDFSASKEAVVHGDRCTGCERCVSVCRFDALAMVDDLAAVDPIACEGCGVCAHICPREAIVMEDVISGNWYISDTDYGPMVHAKLGIAQENSGKLVTQVRREARKIAERAGLDYIIIDGPPGIGCPVISSIAGVDLALIVTEPTVSGIHDLERVLALAEHFGVKTMVGINKYDLDVASTGKIEDYCRDRGALVAGRIPFDEAMVKAVVRGLAVVEYDPNGQAAKMMRAMWANILGCLEDAL
ncbi:MAG: P-loop NTPase [Limnochordia bacterium]|jgi:MinD superfamily P-loop ATPase